MSAGAGGNHPATCLLCWGLGSSFPPWQVYGTAWWQESGLAKDQESLKLPTCSSVFVLQMGRRLFTFCKDFVLSRGHEPGGIQDLKVMKLVTKFHTDIKNKKRNRFISFCLVIFTCPRNKYFLWWRVQVLVYPALQITHQKQRFWSNPVQVVGRKSHPQKPEIVPPSADDVALKTKYPRALISTYEGLRSSTQNFHTNWWNLQMWNFQIYARGKRDVFFSSYREVFFCISTKPSKKWFGRTPTLGFGNAN